MHCDGLPASFLLDETESHAYYSHSLAFCCGTDYHEIMSGSKPCIHVPVDTGLGTRTIDCSGRFCNLAKMSR